MSRTQSLTRGQIDMNLIAEKLIQISERLKVLEDQREVGNVNIPPRSSTKYTNLSSPQEENSISYTISKYEQCLPLIPNFDGTNSEIFINTIIRVSTLLVPTQHTLLLMAILAQKLKGRVALTLRPDVITKISKLIEKIRFLYGKTMDTASIKTRREACKQKPLHR
ncbi:hypothetical protein WH47_05386 [Habropoda laboriosa]|uniref:Uncharacterized protein n=1 Tax=Habropoda laboriosa TaxID=597456 RepID=A0A0L7QJA9_9HYME|nr:hypothetical protein WH47_05386 [Habropoda laboriosa]